MARKYTAVYNPYTFEELMKPLDRYNEAYDKLEQQLDDLEVESAILNKLDPVLDKDAYDLNQAHQNALIDVSGQMSSNGLNPNLRATINNLRRDQRTQLDPLITAYKEREALIKEQRNKGDNYIFSKDYANTPLTEMLTGTNTYNAYNLEDALKEGMVSGKAISSRIYNDPVLAKELRNQYFKMANGIDVDGRTVEQLFNDYPELQQDFNNWYSSQFGDTPAYSDADLKRAQDRYMSGVLRGIVYDEDYKTNTDHRTPHQIFEENISSTQLGITLDKTYGNVIQTPMGDIPEGARGQDIGNGVTIIYPEDKNSQSGYGKPYPVDQATGKRLTDEEASKKVNRGDLVGVDSSTGEKIYNNGKAIIRVDPKTDEIKSIQTISGSGSTQNYGLPINPLNEKVKRYDLFYDFNFDLNINRGTVKPDWEWGKKSSRHYRGTTEEAIEHGYKAVDPTTLSKEAQIKLINYINEHFANYDGNGKLLEGANLALDDLILLYNSDEDTGDKHYRVLLKSEHPELTQAGGTPLTAEEARKKLEEQQGKGGGQQK